MKSKKTVFFCLIIMVVLLTACGKGESKSGTLQEMNYEDFKDEINDNNFTGFAYILADNSAKDENYLGILEGIFENEGSQLVYYDDTKSDEKTHEKYNDEGSNANLYFPQDEIYYIKNGKKISDIDIDSSIQSDKGNKDVANFVKKHND